MDKAAYLNQIQTLLPPGEAFTRQINSSLTDVLNVVAAQLARVDLRSEQLIQECDPRSTVELLNEWEQTFGLPDGCTNTANTLQERRATIIEKLRLGGQSKAYFMAIAQALGYQVEISQYRPFTAGVSRCGQSLAGDQLVRYYWRVKVLQPRLTQFRSGASAAGDSLLKITRADDLECLFNSLKHAHTILIFAYQGV